MVSPLLSHMKKFRPLDISEDIQKKVGKLIILFSHVEWLIANTLLISQIEPKEYEKVKNLPLTQRYFEILLLMSFTKKIEGLRCLGFNVSKLQEVREYRNTISHGIILNRKGRLTIKKSFKPKTKEKDFHSEIILKNINILEEEGGKLIDLITKKGYSCL